MARHSDAERSISGTRVSRQLETRQPNFWIARAVTPLSNTVFPIVFGALMWGGLWLRDRRIRNLLPVIREA